MYLWPMHRRHHHAGRPFPAQGGRCLARYVVMACTVMAHIVIHCIVMACLVVAYVAMACIAVAYIVMAEVVMAYPSTTSSRWTLVRRPRRSLSGQVCSYGTQSPSCTRWAPRFPSSRTARGPVPAKRGRGKGGPAGGQDALQHFSRRPAANLRFHCRVCFASTRARPTSFGFFFGERSV